MGPRDTEVGALEGVREPAPPDTPRTTDQQSACNARVVAVVVACQSTAELHSYGRLRYTVVARSLRSQAVCVCDLRRKDCEQVELSPDHHTCVRLKEEAERAPAVRRRGDWCNRRLPQCL